MKMTLWLAVLLIACTTMVPAWGLRIGSWDDATQRGGDLYTPSSTDWGYAQLASTLAGRGHTFVAGTNALTPSYLANTDVFFWGVSSRTLSGSEGTALYDFVAHGGKLLVESDTGEVSSGNSATMALGLGPVYTGNIGGSGTTLAGGLFTSALTRTTFGPAGDIRGGTFGTTPEAELLAGAAGTAVGWNSNVLAWAEYVPIPGGQTILCVGDPFGFGLFQRPGASAYNANIQVAYVNYIESVPEPATMALLALGGLVLAKRRRD